MTRLTKALAISLASLALAAGGLVATTASADGRGPHDPARGDTVRMWNQWAGEAAQAACIAPVDNPLSESRAYAMAHIAVHDALNAIDRRYEPYLYDGRAPRHASVAAAVAAAAHDVLVPTLLALPAPFPPECGAAGAAVIEARYQEALADVPDGRSEAAGIAVGRAAAAAVLAAREDDGAGQVLVDPAFPQGDEPGEWRFTPDRPFAFGPGWREVEPFVLDSADQFLPPPPPALGSLRYTRDFIEVKRLGSDGVSHPSRRTADQTEAALFWVESSPLAWNRIARTASESRHQDDWAAARLFGLLNMALADGYVASFETKYHYLYWRPVTAIREAATDGNPFTSPDVDWTPLVVTPPIPDYESAHTVEGAAAAAVMRGVFRTDHVRFATCSLTLPDGQQCDDADPVLRSFRTFSQAAVENGNSRVWNGFHFRTAVERGHELGGAIGELAVETEMQRVRHGR